MIMKIVIIMMNINQIIKELNKKYNYINKLKTYCIILKKH